MSASEPSKTQDPKEEASSSEDEEPIAKRVQPKTKAANGTPATPSRVMPRRGAARKVYREATSSDEDEDDEDDEDGAEASSDDDRPISARKAATPKKRKAAKGGRRSSGSRASKRARRSTAGNPEADGQGGSKKWDTLHHQGVLFPPEYEPHGVKILYDNEPLALTPEEEEVATMFAMMRETEYMNKPTFINNFWEDFKEILGPRHKIQSLEKCDFTPIWEWHLAEKEKKKNLTKEQKAEIKRKKEELEEPYKFALVDGHKEKLGNFRVEPPGLFRGRGEHPKMGKLKKRIKPSDITLNMSKDAPVPVPNMYQDVPWAGVRHDNTVTWLAYWKDPINPREYKYVFLAADSRWKGESDLLKYEKARKLKDFIGDIRKDYTAKWGSKSRRDQQMAVATYWIDVLALRAGHEKEEDEADTVGCCTLKVENVEQVPPQSIKFDFLGKDSMKYENVVEVEPAVYELIGCWREKDEAGKKKKPGDQLFDTFIAQDLNEHLKTLMPGLSAKVFRTYNASITLDRLLREYEAAQPGLMDKLVDEKKAEYDRANKEVAILCNHQRTVPKAHQSQMEKLQAKRKQMEDELKALEEDLAAAKAGKEVEREGKDGKKVTRTLNPDTVAGQIKRKKASLEKLRINMLVKEDLKTVALGTSKINYMDPRITVAFCKRAELPIEKVFAKTLTAKFNWAMDVDPEFRF